MNHSPTQTQDASRLAGSTPFNLLEQQRRRQNSRPRILGSANATVHRPNVIPVPVENFVPCRAPAARRVLVVDDNHDLAESLATVLRLWGHDVRIAFDGRAAVAAAKSRPPDIVLLDIGLPTLDGFEVARQMRANSDLRQTRIVVISGYGRAEDRQRSREAGIDLHLTKPVDPLVLQRLLAGDC